MSNCKDFCKYFFSAKSKKFAVLKEAKRAATYLFLLSQKASNLQELIHILHTCWVLEVQHQVHFEAVIKVLKEVLVKELEVLVKELVVHVKGVLELEEWDNFQLVLVQGLHLALLGLVMEKDKQVEVVMIPLGYLHKLAREKLKWG